MGCLLKICRNKMFRNRGLLLFYKWDAASLENMLDKSEWMGELKSLRHSSSIYFPYYVVCNGIFFVRPTIQFFNINRLVAFLINGFEKVIQVFRIQYWWVTDPWIGINWQWSELTNPNECVFLINVGFIFIMQWITLG